MGNRLTKVIGYGFTDLQEDDPAINWDAIFDYHKNEAKTWDQFIEFCEQDQELLDPTDKIMFNLFKWNLKELIKTKPNHQPDRCFIYDNEYGLKDTIVFIEPGSPDWYRRDDIIDYIWSGIHKIYDPVVYKLNAGIYPYIGSYRNQKTGKKMSDGIAELFLRVYSSSATQKEVKAAKQTMDILAQKFEFDGFDDLIENIMPIPPFTIIKYIEFMNFVRDKTIFNQLRPLAYQLIH